MKALKIALLLGLTLGLTAANCTPSGSADTGTSGQDAGQTAEDAGETVEDGGTTTPPTPATIAELRAMADGPVNALLEDVYVTYVRTKGFYVQSIPTGPAIYYYTNTVDPVTLGIVAGNKIDLHVTELGSYNGLREIVAAAVDANDGGSYPVDGMAQDLSAGAGIPPGEDHESELVKLTGVTVMSGGGNDFTIRYGTGPTEAAFYSYIGTCVGATLDIVRAVVEENNGSYTIKNFYQDDLTNVDPSGCRQFDDSNWGFEDWSSSPIDDFEYMGNAMTVEQESTLVHGGSSSARVTWTSSDNQDLRAGYRFPATAGTAYTCQVFVLDNDAAGKTRVFVTWWDADGTYLSNSFADDNWSVDNADWNAYSITATAPADTSGVTCAVRFYDESSAWDGDATIYVDDLTMN